MRGAEQVGRLAVCLTDSCMPLLISVSFIAELAPCSKFLAVASPSILS